MSANTRREAPPAMGAATQSPKINHSSHKHPQNGNQQTRIPQNQAYVPTIDPNLAAIAQSFGMPGLPSNTMHSNAWVTNGHYYFPSALAHPSHGQNGLAQGFGTYLSHPGYVGGYTHQPLMENPMPGSWPSSRIPSASEMPNLMSSRRDSSSSNEHDVPATPYTHYHGYTNGVAVVDNSPHSMAYAWSTPSTGHSAYSVGKGSRPSVVSQEMIELVNQAPTIPPAVPAPCSPPKPLDRSLENPKGSINVYIRGLQPDTTDAMLYAYGRRFGEIHQSKAIIDFGTGLCKGFGFVQYYNYKDAENCIRGFHCMGYETSFARESFYTQLKKLADDKNTNLYISNLPKDMNEAELAQTFKGYKCCSARILRDSMGNGRGVGFARFESRAVCEEVIRRFQNCPVETKGMPEEHKIQIRYADTQEQKSLKQTTAAARQYRSAEYESQTRYLNGAATPNPIHVSLPATGDFETYMKYATGGSLPQSRQTSSTCGNDTLTCERGNQASVHFSPDPSKRPSKTVSTKAPVFNTGDGDGIALSSGANTNHKVTADSLQQSMSVFEAKPASETA